MFELFCLVNNFMIWKRKKKKKKKTCNGGGRFDPGTFGLHISRFTTELPKPTTITYVTKYVFIFNMASRTIRPSTCAIPQFQFRLKKTRIKCIIKVVNVSKSQSYEFRLNIMNLGNQNSKYSWPIRDLENPQTGTQFANSVLLYKIRRSLKSWGPQIFFFYCEKYWVLTWNKQEIIGWLQYFSEICVQ